MRKSDGQLVDLFNKLWHHKNISVVFTTQNLKSKDIVSLNSPYINIKALRDNVQIRHLLTQFLNHLVMDKNQTTPDELTFKTSIFPPDEYNFIYAPKSKYIFL